MNRTFNSAITLHLPDTCPSDVADAMQAFRDFLWPKGREDSKEALQRRAAFAHENFLDGAVNALRELDDSILYSVLSLLGAPNAFTRAFGALVLMLEAGLEPAIGDMARHVLESTDADDLVDTVQERYGAVTPYFVDEYTDCIRTSHSLVRP